MSITRKELARAIKKSENTIWRYEKSGRAPVYPIKLDYNGEVRYPDNAAELYFEWMSKGRPVSIAA
jgi:hypothetical protein